VGVTSSALQHTKINPKMSAENNTIFVFIRHSFKTVINGYSLIFLTP